MYYKRCLFGASFSSWVECLSTFKWLSSSFFFLFSFPYFSVQPDDFYVNKESSSAPILFINVLCLQYKQLLIWFTSSIQSLDNAFDITPCLLNLFLIFVSLGSMGRIRSFWILQALNNLTLTLFSAKFTCTSHANCNLLIQCITNHYLLISIRHKKLYLLFWTEKYILGRGRGNGGSGVRGKGRVGEGKEEGREDRGTGMPMGHFWVDP